MDAGLTILFCGKNFVVKSKEAKTGPNLAECCKEGCLKKCGLPDDDDDDDDDDNDYLCYYYYYYYLGE
jgi:hypothetical protein